MAGGARGDHGVEEPDAGRTDGAGADIVGADRAAADKAGADRAGAEAAGPGQAAPDAAAPHTAAPDAAAPHAAAADAAAPHAGPHAARPARALAGRRLKAPGRLAGAAVVAGAALLATSGAATPVGWAALFVGAGWVVAAMVAGGALAWWAAAVAAGQVAAALQPALTPFATACWVAIAIALPRGRVRGWRLPVTGALLLGGAVWSVVLLGGPVLGGAGGAGPWMPAVAGCAGAAALAAAFRGTDPVGTRTVQWVTAGMIVLGAACVVLLAVHLLLGTPADPQPWLLGAAVAGPLALALGVHPRTSTAGPAALVQAIVAAGSAALVVGVYLVVVVGFGGRPAPDERDVLLSGVVAALVVAVLALPVRARLAALATDLVRLGPAGSGEFASFGARMTRAVPMDELLLQLVESLRAAVAPAGAEVWVGAGGVLDRAAAVPDLPQRRLVLGVDERIVVGRARSGGSRWMSVWLPVLLAEHVTAHGATAPVRAVPVAHLGALLGVLVLHRQAGADPFTDAEERELVELARQLGLALHNVRLDSALQASLAELRSRNAELQASRARIVTAADEARRTIERDLHDGAQQHLVALAVQLGLARAVADTEPGAVPELLDKLRGDAQAAIGAIRELAHGIYPPLLRDRGLGEALRTVATRSPIPCAVEVQLPGRFPPAVEACAYFCCVEAIQNAGKHAGASASILVQVSGDAAELRFTIGDDGGGFAPGATEGQGFVNMRDRLGAVGGELEITSGRGTTVTARIPVSA